MTRSLLAYIGSLSFVIGSFFAVAQLAQSQETQSAQEPTLLEAKVNPMHPWGIGGGKLAIIDDMVLSPDVGLGETGADRYIQERLHETTPFVAEAPISEENTGEIRTYTVKDGDTVGGIAEEFGISANTIRWANNLGTKGTINIGQELVILPITGVQYTIKKGDTLSSIAKKFGGDVEEILVFNGIESSAKIAIGDTLIIPDGEASTPAPEKKPTFPKVPSQQQPSQSSSGGSGFYSHPVPGARMTQNYHGRWRGRDYGIPIGTPVYASADGVVLVAKASGWNGGYGGLVIIQHQNGSQTLYAHNSSVVVRVGEKVSKGDLVAKSGNSGRSTGPHLHFEIRNGVDIPF